MGRAQLVGRLGLCQQPGLLCLVSMEEKCGQQPTTAGLHTNCSPLLFSLFQSKYNSSISVSVSSSLSPVYLFNWPVKPCDLRWQLMSNVSIPICALFPDLPRDCSRQAQFHEKIPLLLLSCIFLSESIFHKPSFILSMNLIFVTASDAWMRLCCYNPLWQKNIWKKLTARSCRCTWENRGGPSFQRFLLYMFEGLLKTGLKS